jgi:hypothetical protein
LKGKQPFSWPKQADDAFKVLKKAFTSAPVLRHFDARFPIKIETDASGFAAGCILSQLFGKDVDARWHPVAFYSRKFIPAEVNYDVHDQELLAIVLAFRQWRHYLAYTQSTIVVKTDHNNLKYFMTKRKLNGRQARWAEELAVFDFVLEYRVGKTNPADGPSRRPDYEPDDSERDAESSKLYQLLQATEENNKVLHIVALKVIENPATPQYKAQEREGRQLPTGETPGPMILRIGQQKGNGANGETPPLEPVAGIAGCKQRVPRALGLRWGNLETVFDDSDLTLIELLAELQKADHFVQRREYDGWSPSKKAGVIG